MRDWLALPLSPSTLSSIKNNSDEDDCSYDIINRSVTEDDDDPEEQEISTWVTLLAVFGVVKERSRSAREGVAKKKERLRSVSSSASTREEEEVTKEDAVNKEAASTREGLSTKEGLSSECALTRKGLSTECAFTKQEEPRAFTREEESECSEIEETSDDEYEQEISMKRSLSASSIASSTDSDNSTPASSQIIRPSKFFEEMPLNTKTRSVQICWNHGGKMVQVTGEFNNWSVPVDMVEDTKCHVVSIPMDPSKDTEFKFIVDGEWRYAVDLPHRADGRGNVNNVICKQT